MLKKARFIFAAAALLAVLGGSVLFGAGQWADAQAGGTGAVEQNDPLWALVWPARGGVVVDVSAKPFEVGANLKWVKIPRGQDVRAYKAHFDGTDFVVEVEPTPTPSPTPQVIEVTPTSAPSSTATPVPSTATPAPTATPDPAAATLEDLQALIDQLQLQVIDLDNRLTVAEAEIATLTAP